MNRNKSESKSSVVPLTLNFYLPGVAYPASSGTISKKLCSKSTYDVGLTTDAS